MHRLFRGWFLWEDSCKDEFFDGDEEVRLEVFGFGGDDGVLMLFGGYLIRLTFVEFGLLVVETLEMGVLVKYLNCSCSWLSWV